MRMIKMEGGKEREGKENILLKIGL